MICDVHGYADLAHRHPDRIASYIMLPLLHMDAAPLSEHQIHRAVPSASDVSISLRFRIGFAPELREAGDVVA